MVTVWKENRLVEMQLDVNSLPVTVVKDSPCKWNVVGLIYIFGNNFRETSE